MMRFLIGVAVGISCTCLFFIDEMPTCRDYTKSGVVWQGYAAKNDVEKRCFYRETQFPWRTWQGRAD